MALRHRISLGLATVALAAAAVLSVSAVGAVAKPPPPPPPPPDTLCTASTPAPGIVTVCLKEAHEGVTAAGFSDHSCDNIVGRNSSLDYFIFVLPDAGDPGRVFTTPLTVTFSTGTTTGTIGTPSAKFFFASAPPGATLLEAVARANNGLGTPNGGEDQDFNLTHTCPATTTPPPPDTTPPTCKLISTSLGPPKSITVAAQDTGSGIKSIVATTFNATAPVPSFTSGTTSTIDVTATKIDQTKGATLTLTVTDVAGNVTVCDPIFGGPASTLSAIVRAGSHVVIPGLATQQGHLLITGRGGALGKAIVSVDKRRYAVLRVGHSTRSQLDLAAGLSGARAHTVVVSLVGHGTLLVRLTK